MKAFGILFAMMLPMWAEDVVSLVDRVGLAGFQHADSLSDIRTLKDGKHVLSSARDGTVKLWEIETGRLVRTFSWEKEHTFWGLALLEEENQFLVASSSGGVIRYELNTGKVVGRFPSEHTVFRLDVHPNGKWFVSGDGNDTVSLWNFRTGKQIRNFAGHGDDVYTVIFNEDGSRIISGDEDGELKMWNTETGECLKTLGIKFKEVYTITKSSDRKYFAVASDDEKIRVFETDSLRVVWTKKLEGEGKVVAWSPDGTMVATASTDRHLYLFDSKNGEVIRKIPTHDASHTPVAFTRDSKTLISGGSYYLHLHDIATGERIVPTMGLPDLTGSISELAISDDGNTIYGTSGGENILLWHRGPEKFTKRIKEKDEVQAITLSNDGTKLATATSAGMVRILNPKNGDVMESLSTNATVSALVFADKDEKVVVGGSQGDLSLWDIAQGKRLLTYKGHERDLVDLAVGADGITLMSASDDTTVALWNLRSGQRLESMKVPQDRPYDIAWFGRGRSLLVSVNEEPLYGRLLPELPEPVALDPTRVHALTTNLADASFEKREAGMKELAQMGPEVIKVLEKIAKDDPEVRSRIQGVMNLISGKAEGLQLKEVSKFKSDVCALAGTQNQNIWALAYGYNADAELVIGKVVNQEIVILQRITTWNSPCELAFSANGEYLAAGNRDGTVDVFKVNP